MASKAELPEATAGDRAFVRAVAHAFVHDQNLDAVSAARAVASWEVVRELLRVHHAAPIAYRLLAQAEEGGPPIWLREWLRERYLASLTQVAMEPAVVHGLLDGFAAARIPALLTKGMAVGGWLYEDPALRPHGDVDLLVAEADAEKVHALLAGLGYAPTGEPVAPRLHPDESRGAVWYHGRDGRRVDVGYDPLHLFWRPDTDHDATFPRWWERRQEVSVGGHVVPTLGAEDQFVHLARHLQFHDYFRAIWFIDVLLLLRQHGDRLDWNLIGRAARAAGIHGGLFRTLELADRVHDVRAPEPAWDALRPNRVVQALHRRIWPEQLAVPRDHRHLGRSPIVPRAVNPFGAHAVSGLALLALDRNRRRHFGYLVRRVLRMLRPGSRRRATTPG